MAGAALRRLEELERDMEGVYLKFYVSEYREHNGILLFEWLQERAKKCGFHGGTAMRAVAGFGRHGILHEETFLELAADLPVEVSFVLSKDEAKAFLDLLQGENIDLFYARFPVDYGFLPANHIDDWGAGETSSNL
jgi:PII-like signaling protein